MLDLKDSYFDLQQMPLVAVYDMRLNSTDMDRLQAAGNIVIRKVAKDPGNKTKIRALHDQTFTLTDGSTKTRDVHFARGTPALKEYDGDSNECLIEMTREKIQINDLVNSKALYTEWRVADVSLAKEFAGAKVRISHNSTEQEIQAQRRRTVFTRVCPESCPEHSDLFGLREDAESENSTAKSKLQDNRLPFEGPNPQPAPPDRPPAKPKRQEHVRLLHAKRRHDRLPKAVHLQTHTMERSP